MLEISDRKTATFKSIGQAMAIVPPARALRLYGLNGNVGCFESAFSRLLFSGNNFRDGYSGILRSGVSRGTEDAGLAEIRCCKLPKEGAALLRSGDSGKPVRLGVLDLRCKPFF